MDAIKQLRIDAMSDILEEMGLSLTKEQITTLAADFSLHLEMEREHAYYTPPAIKQECEKCKSLRKEVESLEKDITHYKNNVKRRHPGATHVYLDGSTVMYEY